MEASIDKQDLQDIKHFIETKLVQEMNAAGMTFSAMGFVLQTLFDAIKNAESQLDED